MHTFKAMEFILTLFHVKMKTHSKHEDPKYYCMHDINDKKKIKSALLVLISDSLIIALLFS